mmetsp:Transcript_90048/g.183600  ORF Transcript_90048/g.183600 Transcript_90048/m.183600 type:complete len:241 (-) Transcript_90048:17-739(-)
MAGADHKKTPCWRRLAHNRLASEPGFRPQGRCPSGAILPLEARQGCRQQGRHGRCALAILRCESDASVWDIEDLGRATGAWPRPEKKFPGAGSRCCCSLPACRRCCHHLPRANRGRVHPRQGPLQARQRLLPQVPGIRGGVPKASGEGLDRAAGTPGKLRQHLLKAGQPELLCGCGQNLGRCWQAARGGHAVTAGAADEAEPRHVLACDAAVGLRCGHERLLQGQIQGLRGRREDSREGP